MFLIVSYLDINNNKVLNKLKKYENEIMAPQFK